MVRRKSAKGEFWGCSGYPECKNIENIENAPLQQAAANTEIHQQMVLTRTEKPHSYEFGKAGNRHKVYYGKVQELLEQIKLLVDAGLADPIDEQLNGKIIKPDEFE